MKFSRADLPFIRTSLILLAASLLLSALLLFGTSYLKDQAEQQHQAEQQALIQARTQLLQASADEAGWKIFLPRYQSLAKRGWIGQERRLAWLEAIDAVHRQYRLFPVAYQISAQAPYTLQGIPPPEQLDVLASRMTVKLPLLHEGDLIDFLDGLKRASVGFFMTQGCRIQREASAPGDDSSQLQATLSAECTLDWLTLHPK